MAEEKIDYDLIALCIVREAGGEDSPGMLAVACVIRNRSIKRHQRPEHVVMAKLQFSSMTDPNDPQVKADHPLAYYGMAGDKALAIAHQVFDSSTEDPTFGATMYYSDSLRTFPKGWGDPQRYTFTKKIGRHYFYTENPA